MTVPAPHRPLRRRAALLAGVVAMTAAVLLGLLPIGPTAAGASGVNALTGARLTSATTDAQEWDFADALNRERTSRGLPALRVSVGLRVVGRNWSAQMGSVDRLYHNPNLGRDVTQVSNSWASAGENVGVGYSVSSLHDAFMNSEGHRANILGNWNYVGIGVTNANGKIWITAVFLRDGANLTTASRPAPAPPPASWYLRNTNTAGSPNLGFAYGLSDYQTLSCDWDGDGVDTAGVFVGDTFYLRNANSGGSPDITVRFGWPGVKPVCGDWNGDGVDTIGIYSGDTFYMRNSNSGGPSDLVARYGWSAVTPVAGDWNGDNVDTIGVYIDGTWYLRDANSGGNPTKVLSYGARGYAPVVGDWNGDRVDTIGVYAGDTFYLRDSNTNGSPNLSIPYGAAGWRPIAGDWDHDGKTTIGIVQR
jgi:uncharacterized protein YkwD